jgi:hypothetical protein
MRSAANAAIDAIQGDLSKQIGFYFPTDIPTQPPTFLGAENIKKYKGVFGAAVAPATTPAAAAAVAAAMVAAASPPAATLVVPEEGDETFPGLLMRLELSSYEGNPISVCPCHKLSVQHRETVATQMAPSV